MSNFWLDALSNFVAGIASGIVLAVAGAVLGRQRKSQSTVSATGTAASDGVRVTTGDHSPATVVINTVFSSNSSTPTRGRHSTSHATGSGTSDDDVGKIVMLLLVALLIVSGITYLYLRYETIIFMAAVFFASASVAAICSFLGYVSRHGVDFRRDARIQIGAAVIGFAVVLLDLTFLLIDASDPSNAPIRGDAKNMSLSDFIAAHSTLEMFPIIYRFLGLLVALSAVALSLIAGLGLVGRVRLTTDALAKREPSSLWSTVADFGPRTWAFLIPLALTATLSVLLCSGTVYRWINRETEVPELLKTDTNIEISAKRGASSYVICGKLVNETAALADLNIQLEKLSREISWVAVDVPLQTDSDGEACTTRPRTKVRSEYRWVFLGDGRNHGTVSKTVVLQARK